jgi:hypothetical protein
VFAIRYGGQHPNIIARLDNDPAMCDFVVSETGELKCTVGDDGRLLPYAQAIVDAKHGRIQNPGLTRPKRWWHFWR